LFRKESSGAFSRMAGLESLEMRYSEQFHPEWGYLAPAPSFVRTARAVLVATAIGVVAGAGVVFSFVDHPASETSVALRTLAQPSEPLGSTLSPLAQAKGSPTTSQIAAQAETHSTLQKQSEPSLSALGKLTGEAASNPKTSSPAQASAEPASALAAPSSGDPPEKNAVAPPPDAAETPAAGPEQVKKKAIKKPNVTSHYAWRGGYYNDSGRWGGYYGDRGWRYRDDW
jgi:hypothetical protein